MKPEQIEALRSGDWNPTGYRPDRMKAPTETQDWSASEKLGLSVGLSAPERASARHHILGLLNQWPLQSCVVHAGFQSIRADMHRQGIPNPPLGSRGFGYNVTRLLHDALEYDEGTYIRLFFEAIAKHGFPTEDAWPYTQDRLPTKEGPKPRWQCVPDARTFQLAIDMKAKIGVAYARVYETGYDRVETLQRAIAQGFTFVHGFLAPDYYVRNNFDPTKALDPPTKGTAIAGGHAECGAEYDEHGFKGPQSWDDDDDRIKWGDQGWWYKSHDWIADHSWDVWIVKAVPLFPGFGLEAST